MNGASISHSRSERSLEYGRRDEDIRGLHKPDVLLIEPYYPPSSLREPLGLNRRGVKFPRCHVVFEAITTSW